MTPLLDSYKGGCDTVTLVLNLESGSVLAYALIFAIALARTYLIFSKPLQYDDFPASRHSIINANASGERALTEHRQSSG